MNIISIISISAMIMFQTGIKAKKLRGCSSDAACESNNDNLDAIGALLNVASTEDSLSKADDPHLADGGHPRRNLVI